MNKKRVVTTACVALVERIPIYPRAGSDFSRLALSMAIREARERFRLFSYDTLLCIPIYFFHAEMRRVSDYVIVVNRRRAGGRTHGVVLFTPTHGSACTTNPTRLRH